MKRVITSNWFRNTVITLSVGLLLLFISIAYYDDYGKGIALQKINEADTYLAVNAIGDALKIYDELLWKVPGSKRPAIYSRIKNNQGFCYHKLSTVENKEQNLGKAILFYEEAVRFRDIEEYPEAHAETQTNLAAAYWALSEVRNTEENLKKVMHAYEQALKVYTKERYPANHSYILGKLETVKRLLWEIQKEKV